jgi:hypothetical protein
MNNSNKEIQMTAHDYFNNPLIPRGFYNVTCLDLIAVPQAPSPNPLLIAQLKVVPFAPYGDAQNVILFVTLRASEKASPMHQKFRKAFGITASYDEAKGRFGCIAVDDAEYQSTKYSAVHFIEQSPKAKNDAKSLWASDQDGDIEWD